jgi:hypothetical protein
MSLRGRLEKLEQKARFIRRPDPVDPFALAKSGELSAPDARYLCEIFRGAGYVNEAEELESIYKERSTVG